MRPLLCLALIGAAGACSNILVTPAASADGTALVGDNDDSSKRHGLVAHFAASDHAPGAMREVWDFEKGTLNGLIPEPNHTYNVISHGNEFGVVIAETTHGGISKLTGGNGTIMDYGSLIMTTLQRSRTAREAIKTIAALCESHGYASSMEGFSISDGDESWYMELIGKGDFGKGLLYVALKVPDGHFVANANQARITSFLPCTDESTCLMAPDVTSFAIARGLWNSSATDPAFSFSDVYDPLTPTGARFCEARVWYIYRMLAHPDDFDADYYLPYAQGFNLTRRMPLFVRPKRKLSRADVHAALSSKYEGSWLDPTADVGAGAEASPYRDNGLSYQVRGEAFVNERIVGTQFTAWHFVASIRGSSVPPPMRALLWWGSDDHAWAPKVPIFGGATGVHRSYDDANCSARLACRVAAGLPGSMMAFSWESAYWVNSAVARLVYQDVSRASKVVACARDQFEAWAAPMVQATEAQASAQWAAGDAAATAAALTSLAIAAGAEATSRWTQLWQQLMVTFQDGQTAEEDPSNLLCGCTKAAPTYPEVWLEKVANDTGDHYRLPNKDCAYIDADGHCHPHAPGPPITRFSTGFSPFFAPIPTIVEAVEPDRPPTHAAPIEAPTEFAPVPKLQVRGVLG